MKLVRYEVQTACKSGPVSVGGRRTLAAAKALRDDYRARYGSQDIRIIRWRGEVVSDGRRAGR